MGTKKFKYILDYLKYSLTFNDNISSTGGRTHTVDSPASVAACIFHSNIS